MNAKQRVFVEHYLQCWNATQAATEAGYAHPRQQGSRLLSNVNIEAAIKNRLNELQMGADEVLVRMADTARFDPLQFVRKYELNDGQRVRQYVGIDLEALKAAGLGGVVKGIKYDRSGRLVVEFHDSQAAQQLIGQHHKLFTQKHQVDVPQLEPLPEMLSRLLDQVYGPAPEDSDAGVD